MYSIDVTYKNFKGQDVTATRYFNFTVQELLDKELLAEESFSKKLTRIGESNNNVEIYKIFTELLMDSVGIPSDDGSIFHKSDQLRNDFRNSKEFEEILLRFFKDPSEAATFANELIPEETRKRLAESIGEEEKPAYILEGREPNEKELLSMPPEELKRVYLKKLQGGKSDNE
jgi:hypothetical protein